MTAALPDHDPFRRGHRARRRGREDGSKTGRMAAKPEPVRTELADEDEGDGRERRAPRLRRLPPGIFAPLAAIVLAVLAAMAVMTWLAMRHNQMGREVSRLTTEKVRLNDLNRRLRADMDALTVLEDLETVARERLGLVSPSQGQIEIIE